MLKRSTMSILVAIALSGGLLALAADQLTQADQTSAQRSDVLSVDEILQRVHEQYPGKVVETELKHKRGRYVYEIDVVDDHGVRKELKYDAGTGALISSKVEDEDED
jgi:uncharacterized membrane protein YkoI